MRQSTTNETQDLTKDFENVTAREMDLRYEADLAATERALILGQMHRAGMSYAEIANAVSLSRSRVQQMVEKVRESAEGKDSRS